jgi:hypothetical protein
VRNLQVAFGAQFLPTRIEKERKAVLAEAQMMNTIEYRMDCQLLKYLHEENNLGHRFPIGMVEQVWRPLARSRHSRACVGCLRAQRSLFSVGWQAVDCSGSHRRCAP